MMRLNLVVMLVVLFVDMVAGPITPTKLLEKLPKLPKLEEKITSVINSLTTAYDKRVRPNFGESPVEVAVLMYILSVSSISEIDMDFTLDFKYQLIWKDPRLSFTKFDDTEYISLGPDFSNNIWAPDIYFVNRKSSVIHLSRYYNSSIQVKYDGTISSSIRLTITATCTMNLLYFPMDRQLCHLELGSSQCDGFALWLNFLHGAVGYTADEIRFKWKDGPQSVVVSNVVSLTQFRLRGHRIRDKYVYFDAGNYSRLRLELLFERAIGFYVIQIYIPASLVVIISWVSFWIHRVEAPARVPLGVTTMLTILTIFTSTNEALPKVSCIKAMDVYLGTCLLMVFSSLLEYAVVGYLAKKIQMRKIHYLEAQEAKDYTKIEIHAHPARHSRPDFTRTIPSELDAIWGITPADIDKYARIVFPVTFACFNLTYWMIYLNVSNGVDEGLVKTKLEL